MLNDGNAERRTLKVEDMKLTRVALALMMCAPIAAQQVSAQSTTGAGSKTVQINRAARDTWTPMMDVLRPTRAVVVTDAQLQPKTSSAR